MKAKNEENSLRNDAVMTGSRKDDPFMTKIRITYIFGTFVVLILVVGALLFVGSYGAQQSLEEMQALAVDHARGKDAINDLMEASDFLTEQARAFVSTGDPEYGLAYQKEVKATKRRDKSLQMIKSFNASDNVYASLESALNDSNELTETEYYAMHLAAVGYGLREAEYERFDGNTILSDEDKALSDDEKKEKALTMMYDDAYTEKKGLITDHVRESLDLLDEELEERQLDSYKKATRKSHIEHIMLAILLAGFLVLLFLTAIMIVDPIRKSAMYISRNEPLPTKGSAEYFTLSEAYNRMLRLSKINQEQLSYDATHDELTGLYNRKVFEDKRTELEGTDTAMLIIDIDHFKTVNDTFGHEAGDKVLQKVGSILLSSFRLEDYVCRIGGDEFAILMVQMEPSLKHVVKSKIERVREKLRVIDEVPPATLSIGAAFSQDEGPEEGLFNKADKALYSVKETGRDNYRFYSDLQKIREQE